MIDFVQIINKYKDKKDSASFTAFEIDVESRLVVFPGNHILYKNKVFKTNNSLKAFYVFNQNNKDFIVDFTKGSQTTTMKINELKNIDVDSFINKELANGKEN